MKRLLFMLLIPLVLLSGCNPSHDEQEILKIAKSIPLPTLPYDSSNGDKFIYGNTFTRLIQYNVYDGKPMYEIKVYYYDSGLLNRWANHHNFYSLETPNGWFFTLEGWQYQSSNATWVEHY